MRQIKFNIPDNKIQSFLAILSYCEKNQKKFNFLINDQTSFFLQRIKVLIPELITSNISDNPLDVNVNIDHKIPRTQIDGVSKSLIFPKLILKYKKTNKLNKVLFVGLLTRKRYFILLKFLWKLDKRDFFKALFLAAGMKELNGNSIHVINSLRGRQSNNKYWDEKYYELLSKYKFSFCPPGDFKWTYRYYESLLLGVIPVVNNNNCKSLKFGSIEPFQIKSNKFNFQKLKIESDLFI